METNGLMHKRKKSYRSCQKKCAGRTKGKFKKCVRKCYGKKRK